MTNIYLHPLTGNGKPVVMLHGLAATGESFSDLRKKLGDEVTILTFDLHGFGKSPDFPPGKAGIDGHVTSVLSRLSGIDEPIAIVGHSMGGRIALLVHESLSLETPSRAGPLVLIAPAIKAADLAKLASTNPPASVAGLNPAEIAALTVLNAVREIPATAEDAKKYATNFAPNRTWMVTSAPPLAHNLLGYAEKIRNVDTRLLFVWGEKDKVLPIEHLGEFLKLNLSASAIKVPSVGHIPHEEAPDVALKPIVKLLSEWAT